ncbi:OmpA family protein [Marinigracilibium pacificum]|uniref:OmpA family protein n=1 Tax=Marinigracilibium pacificum TaxID=2729599 RepID=A0A848J252_9BACT|nr:OmpA family protein [Marinigracilibium pacificum]NMM48620.1 OmpA family protein [Marinigracilibium pacificum]
MKVMPRIIFYAGLMLLLVTKPFDITAQNDNEEIAKQLVELGKETMRATQALEIAKEQFVQAADLDPDNIEANWLSGEYIQRTSNKDRSVKYFKKVYELDPDYRFDVLYWIGRGYQYGYDFSSALEYYQRYYDKLYADVNYRGMDKVTVKEVEKKIQEAKNGIEFMANPMNFSIVNVGSQINSPMPDYGPVLNEDETIMIFTSRRKEDNLNQDVFEDNFPYEDIFISYKKDGQWTQARNIGDAVNTPFHDSNLALSADGNDLYIYMDENEGDIYISSRIDDSTWSEPEPLSDAINSLNFNEKSISISPDKSIMFFSSNRPGGFGGDDIYYATKNEKGEWSRSKNLGPVINTEYNEDGPFIDYDGKTLYFSSNGRGGMGGYDLFKVEYDSVGDTWGDPVNLGYPINTPDDDIYFVSTKDGKRGYYASIREDGMGFTDIYMVTIPENLDEQLLAAKVDDNVSEEKDIVTPVIDPVVEETIPEPEIDPEPEIETEPVPEPEPMVKEPVQLVVATFGDGAPINAKVRLTKKDDNTVVAVGTKQPGVYISNLTLDEPAEYVLSAEFPGYVFKNMVVNIPASTSEVQTITKTIDLQRASTGARGVLRNIYFKFDRAELTDNSFNELNKLERMMAENPGIRVEIAGHTDNIGAAAYNKDLSKRRAMAVVNYLIDKGIDPSRLTSVGYGEERPMASNDDESDGRELNRRVEFEIIE